jgi:HEAT repeat protein
MNARRCVFGVFLALSLALCARGAEDAPKEQPKGEGEPVKLDAAKLAELLDQLDSKEAPLRAQAAQALGQAKAEAAVAKLAALLDDPDEGAQWKATVALGAIGTPAVPRLIEALSNEKERARWKAEAALKMIGGDAVPALAEALKDKRSRVRQSAAFLLGETADPRAIEGLAAALADKDEDTRWKAATALTKIGKAATAAVLNQLTAESIEARRCAAWVFQQAPDPDAVPRLVLALKDADEQVRWKAAIALQKVGAPAAAPLLILLRSNARDDEKKMVAWVLEGIKDVKVQAALRDLEAAQPRPEGQTPPLLRPRPAVLPKSVTIQITSAPAQATVFIDDKYAGVTPLTVKDIAPGHHFVKLTKRDHLPWTQLKELLFAEEKIEAKLALKPKGGIVISSEPAQADVYIDGEYEGKTPLEKKNLDANPYSIRVEKEHFLPWDTEVEVKAGEQREVKATLKSKVEGWYVARLKENPNDVSCHTELAHYYMVRGELDKSAKAIAAAVEVMGNGADTSGYAGRLVQEISKMWSQAFQFGGDLQLPAVRKALHAAIHEVWQRNQNKAPLTRFLAELGKPLNADFTKPPK